MTRTPGIVVSGVDFGWGSAGKLNAIVTCLQRLAELRFVVLGTQLGRPILTDLPADAWYEHWPTEPAELRQLLDHHRVAAGLVILDPAAAQALEAAGCPTVFVDSLPYLWTAADVLPFDVSIYCAQKASYLPPACREPLSRIARLHWIDSILPHTTHESRDAHVAIINFGGLHSPTNPDGNPVYLNLVLRPAVAAVMHAGYQRIFICGNVQESDLPADISSLAQLAHVGPLPHGEFLALLGRAGLVLTSPGLTTLLECSSRETPTVCLPPQNLSQMFNSDRFAALTAPECRVRWPEWVLDADEVEQARMSGEESALVVIDSALAAANPQSVHTWLSDRLIDAVRHAQKPQDWSSLANDSGRDGAAQVARLVIDLVNTGRAPATNSYAHTASGCADEPA